MYETQTEKEEEQGQEEDDQLLKKGNIWGEGCMIYGSF